MKAFVKASDRPAVRLLGLVTTLACGVVSLVAHTPSPPAPGIDDDGNGQRTCTPGVSTGFTGNPDWAAENGAVGQGADGRGGVAVGVMASSGPVVGAMVSVRGGDEALIGSAETGADGRVTLVTCNASGPFQIEATGRAGATYVDESLGAQGGPAEFGAGQKLRSIVPAITGNIGVTPFSEAAVQRLLASGVGGSAVTKAVPPAAQASSANAEVGQMLATLLPAKLVPDDVTRMPALGGAGSTALPDTPAGRYTVALAAFGRQAASFNNTLTTPALTAAQQFARDASDGKIDGFDATGAPVAARAAERAYDPATLGKALQTAASLAGARHAEAALQNELASVIGLAAFGSPAAGGTVVPTPVRWRSSGAVSPLDTAGNDGTPLATEVVGLWSASQQPPSVLFLRRADGSLLAVGDNGAAGRFGNGTATASATPLPVAGLATASALSIGAAHVLARQADGSLAGWGQGGQGQLAGATATLLPQPVPGVDDVVSALALGDLSFAVRNDGSLLAWGRGAHALGSGADATTTRSTPQPVLAGAEQALTGVVTIAGFIGAGAADATLAALRRDGTVWTWGDNGNGGLGSTGASRSVAAAVDGLADITALATTGNGFIARDRNGGVFFWGRQSAAEGAPVPDIQPPTRLAGLPPIQRIDSGVAGLYQARLLDAEGTRWRTDGLGAEQLSDATELDTTPPSLGITTIAPISADDRINANERTAGVTISGTISMPGLPVTVRIGTAVRTVTATGTNWQVVVPASELPLNGNVEISAAFATPTGQPSGTARRTLTVDTEAPTVSISAAEPNPVNGAITFTFQWSEPVTGFDPGKITVTPGNATRGALNTVSASVYTLVVTPASGSSGAVTVTVAATAANDLAGNANGSGASGNQVVLDTVAPTVQISTVQTVVNASPAANDPGDSGPPLVFETVVQFIWSEPVTVVDGNRFMVSDGQSAPSVLALAARPDLGGNRVWQARVPINVAAGQLTPTITVQAGAVTDGTNGNTAASLQVQRSNFGTGNDGDGSIGGIGDSDGSPGSEGGNDGPTPPVFFIDAQVAGNQIELSWSDVQANPAVRVYFIMYRDRDTANANPLPYELALRSTKRYNMPILASGAPRYAIRLPRSEDRAYRIRACNALVGTNASAKVTGYTGCRDSHEFHWNAKVGKVTIATFEVYAPGYGPPLDERPVTYAFCPEPRSRAFRGSYGTNGAWTYYYYNSEGNPEPTASTVEGEAGGWLTPYEPLHSSFCQDALPDRKYWP